MADDDLTAVREPAAGAETQKKSSGGSQPGWFDLFAVAVLCSVAASLVTYRILAGSIADLQHADAAHNPEIAVFDSVEQVNILTNYPDGSDDRTRIQKQLADRQDELNKRGIIVVDKRALLSMPSQIILPVIQ